MASAGQTSVSLSLSDLARIGGTHDVKEIIARGLKSSSDNQAIVYWAAPVQIYLSDEPGQLMTRGGLQAPAEEETSVLIPLRGPLQDGLIVSHDQDLTLLMGPLA